MFIKSINIKNLYSYGEIGTSELKDLRKINLIIGKNGSGKSNIIRTLLEIPIETINMGDDIDGEIKLSENPDKIFKGIATNENKYQYGYPYLKIETDENNIETKEIEGIVPHISGNNMNRSGRGSQFIENGDEILIELRNRSFYFKIDKAKYLISPELNHEVIDFIQFGFYYILEKIVTLNEESFDEYESIGEDWHHRGGNRIFLSESPDGYLVLINLLKRLYGQGKDILFIEEPENFIEPRALKRLINFLLYYCFNKDESFSCDIKKDIEESYKNYNNLPTHSTNYHTGQRHNSVIQRPTMLSRSNRELFNRDKCGFNQIFVISHSPILIDLIFNLNKQDEERISSIYEVYKEETLNAKPAHEVEVNINRGVYPGEIQTKVSKIRQIGDKLSCWDLLDNLGIKTSDMLLSNGVIWVEGPTDAMYIEQFLHMYSRDEDNFIFRNGRHYSFGIYGGTLLTSYFVYEKKLNNKELNKIISLTSLNKNFYFITDSDAVIKDGEIVDISKFGKAKKYITEEILKLNSDNNGIWYDKDNFEFKTIESYIEKKEVIENEDIKLEGFGLKNKKKNAINLIQYLSSNPNIKLADVGETLVSKIKDVYDKITLWNNM